jgi:hypothetical protein
VTHKYGRPGIVLAVGLLLSSLGLAAPVLASDPPADVILDGVVTIHHVDAEDGPIAGATITLSSYRDGAAPIQVLTATTDGDGNASIGGVARSVDGAESVWLDVRSDLESSLVDGAGCTETSSWFAERRAIVADAAVDVTLDSTAKSVSVSCPEPTSDGAVLAVTSRPRITPPATDSGAADGAPAAPAVGAVLVLIGLAVSSIALTLPGRGRRR